MPVLQKTEALLLLMLCFVTVVCLVFLLLIDCYNPIVVKSTIFFGRQKRKERIAIAL